MHVHHHLVRRPILANAIVNTKYEMDRSAWSSLHHSGHEASNAEEVGELGATPYAVMSEQPAYHMQDSCSQREGA